MDRGLIGVSVKSSQVVQSPTAITPKLLQLQRTTPMSVDVTSSSKENGQASPRRSLDSSSGSIRSDSSAIHPLKYTWVCIPSRNVGLNRGRHFGVCIVLQVKVRQEQQVTTLPPTRKSPPSHPYSPFPKSHVTF